MTVAGPTGVRAYDSGGASGDAGHLASVELRQALGLVAQGQLQGRVFVDAARVKVNQAPWKANTNVTKLNGTGIGIDWSGPDRWQAHVALAKRLGSKPAQVSDISSSWVWVEVAKAF